MAMEEIILQGGGYAVGFYLMWKMANTTIKENTRAIDSNRETHRIQSEEMIKVMTRLCTHLEKNGKKK